MAITSATIMAIRSAKIIGNNISQYINYTLNGLISATNLITSPLILQGKPTLWHQYVLEINLDEHFPQTGWSHDRDLAKACLTTN